jgi:hypothetical protein
MTGEPTLLGHTGPAKARRRGRNRWELALWLFGVFLLVFGLASVYVVSKQLFANVDGNSLQSPDLTWRAIAEILYSLLPGVISGSLLCFIVAIGLRALEGNVARRPAAGLSSPNVAPVAAAVAPVEAAPAASTAPAVAAAAPTAPAATTAPTASTPPTASTASAAPLDRDYSRFMRPPADAG